MQDVAWLTREWVTRLVVGEGLCPFAHPVMPKLRIDVCELTDLNKVTEQFMDLLAEVAAADPVELPTALFVAPAVTPTFDEYWNWAVMCDELLFQMGYEGQLQVATFHPRYQFQGESVDDASNFTNRSPFPTLHIIREADIEAAVASVQFPERIPQRNQRHMRRLGKEGLLALMPELADTAIFR